MEITARELRVTRGGFSLEVPTLAAGPDGLAVVGPNGAGKTTLLLALRGLIPASGTIRRPVRSACVFATPAVLRGGVAWNVAAIAHRAGTTVATPALGELLSTFGLAECGRRDARTLSTGQKQRLALARALAVEPQVLLLDEAFTNVDSEFRPQLRDVVASYVRRTGCALVIATTSLADLSMCSATMLLRAGNVVANGSAAAFAGTDDPYVAALVRENAQACARGARDA